MLHKDGVKGRSDLQQPWEREHQSVTEEKLMFR